MGSSGSDWSRAMENKGIVENLGKEKEHGIKTNTGRDIKRCLERRNI
jgi:hypothetical protein